ncbi:MAG: putative protein N(5)-glutamine methyltransferase, partial [Neobacillus sp.]
MDKMKTSFCCGKFHCDARSKLTIKDEILKNVDDETNHAGKGTLVNGGDFQRDTNYSSIVTRLRAAGCVFAEEEARLLISAALTSADLAAMMELRVTGFPLEHVIGWAEFCGLRIAVDPGVFVPRRRTEFLVRQAVHITRPGALVVDLCCGSGAVGAVLAAAQEGIELYGADID